MSYTILIVDDSAVVRSMVRKSVAMAGLPVGAVIEAGDGREALQVLRREHVDLVFADLNMPEMGGAELVERMARDAALAGTPVVIVSSERSQARMDELRAKGVRGYLQKPFRPEAFREVVAELQRRPPPPGKGERP